MLKNMPCIEVNLVLANTVKFYAECQGSPTRGEDYISKLTGATGYY